MSDKRCEPLNKSDDLQDSAYREAVTEHSPGLPRFAATLGTELRNDRNPNEVVTVSCLVHGVNGNCEFETCVLAIVDDRAWPLHDDLGTR